MGQIEIRPETPSDQGAIYGITADAFRGRPYAGGDEQDVVNRLRDCGALSLSLVAVRGNDVVGQITFSPATAEDGSGPWYALGPVSVTPDLQGEGIGSRLIRAGLEEIAGRGALGCILTGNPEYYRRFDFEVMPEHAPLREPGEFFMLKCLHGEAPAGRFEFHDAFYVEA